MKLDILDAEIVEKIREKRITKTFSVIFKTDNDELVYKLNLVHLYFPIQNFDTGEPSVYLYEGEDVDGKFYWDFNPEGEELLIEEDLKKKILNHPKVRLKYKLFESSIK